MKKFSSIIQDYPELIDVHVFLIQKIIFSIYKHKQCKGANFKTKGAKRH